MTLVKLNKRRLPWLPAEFSSFFDDNDFFSDRFWKREIQSEPAINVKETEAEFQVELAVPGLTKGDFDINIENGYLNIFAEKSSTTEDEKDNFTRKEFNYSSFKRSLLLPENVKDEEIKAIYENGILKFNIAKKEIKIEHEAHKVEVE